MDLEDWRARIDGVDRRLVDLLNERMEYCIEIGKIKRGEGRQVQDEKREREVVERLSAYNAGPVGDDAIAAIFARIMAEARTLES